ncbi:Exonuclease V [Geodia barretti]|uniref:Exonuclease V n=1 Tax=Geodia barretti TaxID=519541 RepID=A0AA35SUB2_GEOBA|nr:Exonuclease V [Geodia barretti]
MAESENPLSLPLLPSASDGCNAHKSEDQDVRSPPKKSKTDEAEHGSSPEVEVVKTDEFEFLDGMTRLATLESELEDVKTGLMSRQGLDQFVPFRLLHPWGNRVLSVTDLSGGMWCEVNVEYRKLHRHLKNSREWKRMEEKGIPCGAQDRVHEERFRSPSQERFCLLFLAELEVHEIVKVETVTKEDRAAVQLINTYTQLSVVKTGGMEREVSVFGDPFESGVLVRGIIDQLQYFPEAGELILTDNKTRRAKSLPPTEQKKGTRFQLMLYKYLLDRMCLGLTKGELLYRHLNLERESCLTQGALNHIISCGLSGLFSDELGVAGGLTSSQQGFTEGSSISQQGIGLGLPLVGVLMVHYEHQGSGESLGMDTVEYDEQWMMGELKNRLGYWEGSRPAQGVDIESAWKCSSASSETYAPGDSRDNLKLRRLQDYRHDEKNSLHT